MMDVRNRLFRFLDITQHVWNTCFVDIARSPYDHDPLDSYEAIERELFKSLVCAPLGQSLSEDFILGADPVPKILVRPRPSIGTMPLMVRKPSTDRNMYWEDASSNASGLEGHFIGFFLWNRFDFHSMSQVRFRITQFPAQANAIGRDAIADIVNVDFFGLQSAS